jgi:hypothetical protein
VCILSIAFLIVLCNQAIAGFDAAAPGALEIFGGSKRYITGVTNRANSVEEISPPIITQASGE